MNCVFMVSRTLGFILYVYLTFIVIRRTHVHVGVQEHIDNKIGEKIKATYILITLIDTTLLTFWNRFLQTYVLLFQVYYK